MSKMESFIFMFFLYLIPYLTGAFLYFMFPKLGSLIHIIILIVSIIIWFLFLKEWERENKKK